MSHPKIKEAAVIAIPDEKWVERPLASIVLLNNQDKLIDEELIEKFQLQDVEESETKAAGAGAIGMDTQTSAHNTLEIKNWRNIFYIKQIIH